MRILAVLAAISLAAFMGVAEAQTVTSRQGIEEASAKDSSEAESCEKAMKDATRKAENALSAPSVMFAKRKAITSKKCECKENPKPPAKRETWTCLALVGWEAVN